MSIEIYPVVHIQNTIQAIEQSAHALENGADGVFLIDHNGGNPQRTNKAFVAVDDAFPDSFIGLNYLGYDAPDVFEMVLEDSEKGDLSRLPDALWVDDAIPIASSLGKLASLRDLYPELQTIEYFGGVAFKYTPTETDDPTAAAEQATILSPHIDVVTTSGSETGSAPTTEKIKAMKDAIGDQKLAVASGVTPDNIHLFDPIADKLLLASSIETYSLSGEFDLPQLKNAIHTAHNL